MRAGALSALSCTVFSPERLARRRRSKKDEEDVRRLLTIVAERVSDEDGPTARNAAGCWNNWLLFGGDDTAVDGVDVGTVLSTRVDRCLRPTSDVEKEWDVASVCLQTLCALAEHAADRGDGVDACARTLAAGLRAVRAETADADRAVRVAADGARECLAWAARALHAASDGGPRLPEARRRAVVDVVQDGAAPAVARLHACGLPSTPLDVALPVLVDHVDLRPAIVSALAARVATTEAARRAEESDERVERAVTREVERRREPSRSIARRQKKARAEKERREKEEREARLRQKEQASSSEDAEMTAEDEPSNSDAGTDVGGVTDMEDVSTEEHHQEKNQNKVDRTDAVEEHEAAVKAWKCASEPLRLALEITANVLCGDDDDDDDVDMNDGPALDDAVRAAVLASGLPDRVLAVLEASSSSIPETKERAPFVVEIDAARVRSKCGACLGNAVAALPEWDVPTDRLWRALERATEVNRDVSADASPEERATRSEAAADLLGAAVATVRARGADGVPDRAGALERCATTWETTADADDDASSFADDARRRAVVLSGLLVEAGTIAAATERWVAALRSPAAPLAVVDESWNVLMDVHGSDHDDDDDGRAFDAAYDAANASRVLERECLPASRRRLEEAVKNKDLDEETTERFRETVSNAERFLEYREERRRERA